MHNTIPQIETFRRDTLDDLDKAVNTFVLEKFKETGFACIVKPHANGCTVIYFIQAPEREGLGRAGTGKSCLCSVEVPDRPNRPGRTAEPLAG